MVGRRISALLPLVFLAVFAGVIFSPLIFSGKLPIPADTIVGMYHPWRDFYAPTFPLGIPFKNFQITDSVRQQYPWRELAVSQVLSGKWPVWNPYAFAGSPLLGNLQSAPFYPMNVLYFFGSFASVWAIQVVLQVVLGGLFMYLYLRSMRLLPTAVAVGVIAWVGSGFFVAWLEWNTVVQVAIWIPLILLAVDQIVSGQKRFRWSFIFLFSVVASFLAGYLQPFFYILLFIGAYIAIKVVRAGSLWLFGLFAVLFLLFGIITAPQWSETFKFISLSARDIDQMNWDRQDWFLPWQNLVQFLVPDYFGNPATLNYFGVWNYQEFVGYLGVAGVFFGLLALLFRRDRKTLFFGGVLLFSLVFALPNFLSRVPFLLRIPLISTAQPSRLVMLADFSLAVLAALGVDYFARGRARGAMMRRVCGVLAIFGVGLGSLWVLGLAAESEVSLRNLILPTWLLIALIGLIFGAVIFKGQRTLWLLALVGLVVFDLTRFTIKFEPFSERAYLYPNTKAMEFLATASRREVFRVAAIDDRLLPPNFAVLFRIQTISGYDPLYLRRYGEFIAAAESGAPTLPVSLGFNRIIVPKNYSSKYFDLLGVKYLMSLDEIKSDKYRLVLREGETKVYENASALPRAFFVNQVINVSDRPAALKALFSADFDPLRQAVVEGEGLAPGDFGQTDGAGAATIKKYSENEVVIETMGQQPGLLVLVDSYYPSWKAMIDGSEIKVYPTDYAFRGVVVPGGKHEVRFYYQLFP